MRNAATRSGGRSSRLARALGRLGLALILAYAVAVGALLLFRGALIYPFVGGLDASQVPVPGMRAVRFAAEDGTELIAWVAPPEGDRPVILFFSGNGGIFPVGRFADYVAAGYGIAALNYRGAGGAPGSPSEAAIMADALLLYDQLEELIGAPAQRRVIHGTSLGAAVAVQVAAQREAEALILETPFARLCEVAEHRFPILPACLLLPGDRWDSIDFIGSVEAPILVLHGTEDRVIPLSQAERILAAAPEPKRMIRYPGAGHALGRTDAGRDIMVFLEALAGGR